MINAPPPMAFLWSQKITTWYYQKLAYQREFGNIFIHASKFIMDSPLIKFVTFAATTCTYMSSYKGVLECCCHGNPKTDGGDEGVG